MEQLYALAISKRARSINMVAMPRFWNSGWTAREVTCPMPQLPSEPSLVPVLVTLGLLVLLCLLVLPKLLLPLALLLLPLLLQLLLLLALMIPGVVLELLVRLSGNFASESPKAVEEEEAGNGGLLTTEA